jgi:2-methylisocitrate lyase-like PEP mutase family enzyme
MSNFHGSSGESHAEKSNHSGCVRRISVGGALARSAWGGFIRMAKEIAEQGTFTGFKDAASGAELNAFFTKDKAAREQ